MVTVQQLRAGGADGAAAMWTPCTHVDLPPDAGVYSEPWARSAARMCSLCVQNSRRRLSGHKQGITAVTSVRAASGRLAATCSQDSHVRLWRGCDDYGNLADGAQVQLRHLARLVVCVPDRRVLCGMYT